MIATLKSEQKLNYETAGACAFDLKANEDITIQSWNTWLIETWTAIKVPEWYMLMLAPRSSTYKKLGLILVNSVWIIDNDYCWNDDTIKFQYLNLTPNDVTIKKWDRIWQGTFVKIEKATFNYVDEMEWENRGWFWTTWLNG